MLDCGVKKLCSLCTHDIDPSRRTIWVRAENTKGRRDRVVPYSATGVLLFGMTLLQSVAATKVINVFSSGAATLAFIWRGVVDLNLGIVLGAFMFLGALLGGRIALFLSAVWLAADLHSRGAWLSDQATIAAALGSRLVESNTPAPITKNRHRLCRRLGVPLSRVGSLPSTVGPLQSKTGDKTLLFDTSDSELNPTTPGPPP